MAEAVSTAPVPDTRKPWLEFALHHRPGGLTLAAEAILCASITVLVGPSGAGKTTLLRAIAGLLRPARGRIAICGVAVYNSDRHICLKPGRRACGMVMQRPALFPAMTARQNIAFGLASLGAAERRQRVERMVALFRLGAFVDRHPWQLSGGEQQRVALARALAPEPLGLLLDEPFAGLNPELKEDILADLEAWLATRSTPALYVTHDVAEAWRLAARPSAEVLRMQEGRIVAQGSAATVLGRDRERLLLALS